HGADPGRPGPQADGPDLRPGGDVPLPPVRRSLVDHRARVQRRRRPGRPPVTPGRDGADHRIELEFLDHVLVVAFDRPEARNAFDRAMYRAVAGALSGALGDDDVHAVVLTGRGKAFTSGQDLREMVAIATGGAGSDAEPGFQVLLDLLMRFDKPLLAAVHGVGMGLGCSILGHVDLVLMDESARLRVPFAGLGVPPAAASSYLLPARMGW